jgi:hypothetical protein
VRGASRIGDDLAALAGDSNSLVAARCPCVLDIPRRLFEHPQTAQHEQGDEGVLGRRAESGGDEDRAEIVAIQGQNARRRRQPRRTLR